MDLQVLEVEVGLVETVEEHGALRAGELDLAEEVGGGGVPGGDLHRDGDADRLDDLAHDEDLLGLDVGGVLVGVGGEGVEVELEGVRAGVGEAFGVVHPGAGAVGVERGDDGDAEGGLQPGELAEVEVGREGVVVVMREVVGGLGVALGDAVDEAEAGVFLELDLFGEERVHDERGGAGVLQAFADVEAVAAGRGADDERVAELEAEVVGGEVHASEGLGAGSVEQGGEDRGRAGPPWWSGRG